MFILSGTGNLTKTPILRKLPNQSDVSVCDFTLAVNERRRVKTEIVEKTCFLNFTIFSTAAETLCKYAKIGDKILVFGTPRQDTWSDKTTGEKRTKLYFRADSFEFCGKAKRNQDENTEEIEEVEKVEEDENVDF